MKSAMLRIHAWRAYISRVLLVLLLAGMTTQAWAIPAFSRQVNMPCAACHVGAFGPQLTPFGRQFKLMGYTLKAASSGFTPKLSLAVIEAYTHTKKDQPGPAAPGFSSNDNWEMQTAGLYLAGAISEHMGMFMQASYSQNGHTVGWDMTDIRYARTVRFGSHTAVWGFTLNNNPTISDVYNTVPAWQYPYAGPDLAPEMEASPIITGGFMSGVLGVTGYAQIDGKWYLEGGLYRVPSKAFLDNVNGMYPGRMNTPAPYLRAAYQANLKSQSNFEIGVLYFEPRLHPSDGMGGMGVTAAAMATGVDRFKDYGFDASYQWLGGGKQSVTAQGQYIHESARLDGSFAAGSAANLYDHLDAFNANATYWYDNTYGASAGFFSVDGTRDAMRYPTSGSPASQGGVIELNWVPWGKSGSWASPYLNLRVGLQYTFYSKFNGITRKASDNNTVFLYFQSFLF